MADEDVIEMGADGTFELSPPPAQKPKPKKKRSRAKKKKPAAEAKPKEAAAEPPKPPLKSTYSVVANDAALQVNLSLAPKPGAAAPAVVQPSAVTMRASESRLWLAVDGVGSFSVELPKEVAPATAEAALRPTLDDGRVRISVVVQLAN
uniref:Uncharacterized protein n=1 Tax=Phaeomonas parva TaxID=124430 RepID=A0A7S1UF60_9STRA|mmetsp:Transcript_43625/g.136896  ORF Transcript_43625/g.136896 Transcript_43625/m.136896 type:complete len:149 (+) Transcript_43625:188-634(+)